VIQSVCFSCCNAGPLAAQMLTAKQIPASHIWCCKGQRTSCALCGSVKTHNCICSYTDVWRHLHPDTDDCFTVWDEYTSARLSNEVRLSAERCRVSWSLNTLCARATCPHSRQCEMCSADARSRLTLVPAAVLNATQSCSTVPGTIKRSENPRKGLPIATAGLQDRLRAGQPGPHGQGGVLRAPVQHASEMVSADAPRNAPLDASLLCCAHLVLCAPPNYTAWRCLRGAACELAAEQRHERSSDADDTDCAM